jgi:hypothetical protein
MLNTLLFLAAAAVSCLVVAKAWQHSQQHQQPQPDPHKANSKEAAKEEEVENSNNHHLPATASGTANNNNNNNNNNKNKHDDVKQQKISLAFLGNSMLYFNDCPRLVERLLLVLLPTAAKTTGGGVDDNDDDDVTVFVVHQDSCLRGGATLSSLWTQGNGMLKKFRTAHQAAKKKKKTASRDKQGDNKNGDDEEEEEEEYDIGAPTVTELIQSQQAWWRQQQRQQQQDQEECAAGGSPKNVPKETTTTFIIINDHTQHPAREATRQESLQVLKSLYAPLIYGSNNSNNNNNNNSKDDSSSSSSSPSRAVVPAVVVIFIQTPAYKLVNMRHTEDLGSFDNFTERVAQGVAQYAQLMRRERRDYMKRHQQQDEDDKDNKTMTMAAGNDNKNDDDDDEDWCRVAPVGQAYQYLRETNVTLWEKLYSWDNFHPSPHGTWLQACILYCTITKQRALLLPNDEDIEAIIMPLLLQQQQQQQGVDNHQATTWYWKSWSRVMQPPDEGPLPLPTVPEALELLRVASMVCGVQ